MSTVWSRGPLCPCIVDINWFEVVLTSLFPVTAAAECWCWLHQMSRAGAAWFLPPCAALPVLQYQAGSQQLYRDYCCRTMTLLTVVRRVDVDKMLRQSVIMLRILLCFDIFFLVSTVVQVIWMTPAVLQRDDGSWDLSFLASQPYLHSYSILALFTTTLLCNRWGREEENIEY